jgi:hypothetical protein
VLSAAETTASSVSVQVSPVVPPPDTPVFVPLPAFGGSPDDGSDGSG